ncbi:MAG: glycosyltransferase family 2 protein [Dorea sp.]|nr:glycosyltransferase family 2 protein [Dorea sp.]
MVSIIIPVYNVEKYIDCCIESVVHQTYPNIEILIMEAKSTDRSLEKAMYWAENDCRITVISRKDGGLGPARNYALNIVRGEYVTFLDSDDWFEYDYIEKMLKAIEVCDEIDIAISEVMFHFEQTGIKHYARNSWKNGVYEKIFDKKRMMRFGNNSIWGKLYRTELFTRNNVEQPPLPFEDLSVYLELLGMARKIAICNDTYIHYRAQREGSLFGIRENYKKFPKVMKWSELGLRKNKIYNLYKKAFDFTMYYHFRNLCNKYIDVLNKDEIKKIFPDENSYLEQHFLQFGPCSKIKYWGYGSFAVRWIIHRLENGKEGLVEHFTFTNLISQMTSNDINVSCLVKNDIMKSNRKEWLINDIQGKIYHLMLSKELDIPDLFLIDFIQECQNVFYFGDGNYITDSELLQESSISTKGMEKIAWGSFRFMEIWKEKCDTFIKLLKEKKLTKVVLIESYYPQYYVEQGKKYKYDVDYRRENSILKDMYVYFKEKWGEVITFSIPEVFLYTDVSSQGYEAKPVYLNPQAYNYVAEQIDTMRFM